MPFFTSAAITVAAHKCQPEIDAVARFLPFSDTNDFKDACRTYNREKANEIVDNALKTYLNSIELFFALEGFCEKFGIAADFYGKSMPDMCIFIASHEAEISSKLNGKGIL